MNNQLAGGLFLLALAVWISWWLESALSFAALAILPIMIIATAAVDGYSRRPKYRLYGCGVAACLFGCFVATGMAILPFIGDAVVAAVALVFAAVALRRAVWLEKQRARPAAVTLAVATLFLAALAIAFSGYHVAQYDEKLQRGIREVVAYQLSSREYSHQFESLTGPQVVERWKDEFMAKAHRDDPAPRPVASIATEYSKDRFTISVNPRGPFPFFPYNLLTSWIVYRGDESGNIRAEHVHTDRFASPNAPVIARVGDLRWLAMNDAASTRYALAELQQRWNRIDIGAEVVRHGNDATRAEAVSTLYDAKSPIATDALIAALGDRSKEVRRSAAFYLGLRKDRKATPALVAALRDPVDEVMFAARSALEELRDPAALPLLEPLLHDSSVPEKVRYQAEIAIRAIGTTGTSALPEPRPSSQTKRSSTR